MTKHRTRTSTIAVGLVLLAALGVGACSSSGSEATPTTRPTTTSTTSTSTTAATTTAAVTTAPPDTDASNELAAIDQQLNRLGGQIDAAGSTTEGDVNP